MSIRLGYHAITWGPDTLCAMKDISDLGFRGIECFTQVADQYRDKPALFEKLLLAHSLDLVALYGGGRMLRETRAADVEYNRRVAEFVAAAGGDRIMLGGGDRRRDATGQDHFTDDDVMDLCETLNRIGEACLAAGVKACYHPHVDTIGEERENVDRIFEMTEPELVFAGPDPAHLFLGGYDPVEFFSRYAKRIAYMHIKDVAARYNAANWRAEQERQRSTPRASGSSAGDRKSEPIFCELGRGQLDLAGILRVLRESGYDGWVTTEVDKTTLGSARESARVNRLWWEKQGFEFET